MRRLLPAPGGLAAVAAVSLAALFMAPAGSPSASPPPTPSSAHPHSEPARPFDNRLEWPLATLRAQTIWNEFGSGTGVRIAEIDTGIDWRAPDLRSAVLANYDLLPSGDRDHGLDISRDSHGTIIAGLIAARGSEFTRTHMVGLARLASLIDIRVAVQPTAITPALAARAIMLAVRARATIINVSLNVDDGSAALSRAIRYALSHHCAIVAAAGSPGQPQALAQYAGVVLVAAATRSSTPLIAPVVAGPATLYAPGADLESTSENVHGAPRYAERISGNAFAAAYVSAAIALVLSAKFGPADHAAGLVIDGAGRSDDGIKILDVIGAFQHAMQPRPEGHPRKPTIAVGGRSGPSVDISAAAIALMIMLLILVVPVWRRRRSRMIPASPADPPALTGPDPSYEGSSWDSSW